MGHYLEQCESLSVVPSVTLTVRCSDLSHEHVRIQCNLPKYFVGREAAMGRVTGAMTAAGVPPCCVGVMCGKV